MIKLTIIVNSPSEFTTVIRDNEEEISRRSYVNSRNCSYTKESADMMKPYVTDALQAMIDRYEVQDVEIQVWDQETAENTFEKTFCKNLTTYTLYPNNTLPELRDTRVKEQREELSSISDRELCQAVTLHFNSHPLQAGQKNLKTMASEAFKSEGEVSLSTYQRDLMVVSFAYMQIQETKLNGSHLECDPQLLDRELIATKNNTTVYKIEAALQKKEDGSVSVVGKSDGAEIELGSLQDTFLQKNPMNVDQCNAEVELTDFSNGKMKNLKVRVVVNSDEMSGNIIHLDNDMLTGLESNNGLSM